jgi:hypothetical protein
VPVSIPKRREQVRVKERRVRRKEGGWGGQKDEKVKTGHMQMRLLATDSLHEGRVLECDCRTLSMICDMNVRVPKKFGCFLWAV